MFVVAHNDKAEVDKRRFAPQRFLPLGERLYSLKRFLKIAFMAIFFKSFLADAVNGKDERIEPASNGIFRFARIGKQMSIRTRSDPDPLFDGQRQSYQTRMGA